ncbi:MAG TPA: hypothetical protein VKU40_18020 [Thermoanaerobaculia bacterium]|nr:hypothetical protein [Thermoanaerobaculia bacterium]
MRTIRFPLLLAATMLLLAAPGQAAEAPLATTTHFAFHSDLATNLNDALVVTAEARGRDRPELFESGDEQECFDGLAPSARLGWDLAVDWYAEVVAEGGWMGRPQSLLRHDLAGLPGRDDGERARRFLSIARGFLATASPAYEACRWPDQQAENRRWISELVPRVETHGAALTSRIEKAFGASYHGLPLRVDVVGHAPPVGANTIWLSPAGGHILVSSGLSRTDAFEIVFHESAHTLMRRSDPVPRALAAAAGELRIEEPRDLWHVLLFYNVGDATKRTLDAAGEGGEAGYTPYLYAKPHLWGGRWGRYREAVEAHWPGYLAGEVSLDAAMAALLGDLRDDDDAN